MTLRCQSSYTTRAICPGEAQGQRYFFVPVAEFERMIAEDAFLEHAQMFGNYYGTLRETNKHVLDTGINVFLDTYWQGAQQIQSKMPDARSIFILPSAKEKLNHRLHERGQNSEKVIARRMEQAVTEMIHFGSMIISSSMTTSIPQLFVLKTIIRDERLAP